MTTLPEKYFNTLLLEMASLFEGDDCVAGVETADTLRRAVGKVIAVPATPYKYDHLVASALKNATHPCAVAARGCQELLQWEAAGSILDGQVPTSVSSAFTSNYLMGPGCLIEHAALRAGLFMQRPNSYYPLHNHDAVETYVMIEGVGYWTQGKETTRYETGGVIHHPSGMLHAFRTLKQPLVALWRWSGDIGPDTYLLHPDDGLEKNS
jgi:quercetin dioxygenase-like cupin family protein